MIKRALSFMAAPRLQQQMDDGGCSCRRLLIVPGVSYLLLLPGLARR